MSNYRKVEFIIYRFMLISIYGFVVGGGIILIYEIICKLITGKEKVNLIVFSTSLVIGIICSTIYGVKRLKSDIQGSRERLKDKRYQSTLKSLNLMS